MVAVSLSFGGWERAAPPPTVHHAFTTHAYGPPAAHTGGFGEPTCRECHSEFDLNAPGGRVELEGLPPSYEPARSYPIVVSLHSSGMAAAGFQLSARFEDGRPAGALIAVGPRVEIVDSAGVLYAQHSPDGTRSDTPEVARWTVEWVAPSAERRVLFHVAANSANGDNSPLGDLIYTNGHAVDRAVSLRARRAPPSTVPSRR